MGFVDKKNCITRHQKNCLKSTGKWMWLQRTLSNTIKVFFSFTRGLGLEDGRWLLQMHHCCRGFFEKNVRPLLSGKTLSVHITKINNYDDECTSCLWACFQNISQSIFSIWRKLKCFQNHIHWSKLKTLYQKWFTETCKFFWSKHKKTLSFDLSSSLWHGSRPGYNETVEPHFIMRLFSVLVYTPARIMAWSLTAATTVNATIEFLLQGTKMSTL